MIQRFFLVVGGVIGAANSGLFGILLNLLSEAGIAETVFTHFAYKSAIGVDLIPLERVLKVEGVLRLGILTAAKAARMVHPLCGL